MLALIQGQEWLWVALVVIVMFGGSQIPKFAKSLGQAQKEFKEGLKSGQEEDDSADEEAS